MSLASRRLSEHRSALDPQWPCLGGSLRPGWDPDGWTVDQAARVRLLLATGRRRHAGARWLDQLCATADADELVAFCRGLPLYHAERHRLRAAAGLRNAEGGVRLPLLITNPYPVEQLPRTPEPDGAEGDLRGQRVAPHRRP